MIRQRVEELLKPYGSPLGEPGRRRGVRVVEGSAAEARELFEELACLGHDAPIESRTAGSSPGRRVELPDLGFIGYRETSTSGEPTIDCRVNVEGLEKVKFKFVDPTGGSGEQGS